jgi:hypothetical protein
MGVPRVRAVGLTPALTCTGAQGYRDPPAENRRRPTDVPQARQSKQPPRGPGVWFSGSLGSPVTRLASRRFGQGAPVLGTWRRKHRRRRSSPGRLKDLGLRSVRRAPPPSHDRPARRPPKNKRGICRIHRVRPTSDSDSTDRRIAVPLAGPGRPSLRREFDSIRRTISSCLSDWTPAQVYLTPALTCTGTDRVQRLDCGGQTPAD